MAGISDIDRQRERVSAVAATAGRRILAHGLSLQEEVHADVVGALKAGERERAAALRVVLAELRRDAKEGHGDELAVLRRERKRRLDAAEQFQGAGRHELAGKERAEAEMIARYLPPELGEQELAAIVADVIAQTGASSPREIGVVMKAVMARSEGRIDGSKASRAVKAALSA